MDVVRNLITAELGVTPTRVRREPGGCINEGFEVTLPDRSRVFVKINDDAEMFESEATGLRALLATATIRVPRVLRVGCTGDAAFLVLEHVAMTGRSDYVALGHALGELHAYRGSEKFGFDVDNKLGLTLQRNTPWCAAWPAFYKKNRLEAQLEMLQEREGGVEKEFVERVRRVIDRVEEFFDGHEVVQPSLLHGDLWQGNWGFCSGSNKPAIFDPACYWGHNEAELAMMTLFGYLPDEFFEAYHTHMPRARLHVQRVPLYQLYHALNHFNLFGSAYKCMCEDLLRQLEQPPPRAVAA